MKNNFVRCTLVLSKNSDTANNDYAELSQLRVMDHQCYYLDMIYHTVGQ